MTNPPNEPDEHQNDEDGFLEAFNRWEQNRPDRLTDGSLDLPLTEDELLLEHELAQSPEALLSAAARQAKFRLILTAILVMALGLAAWLNRDDISYMIGNDSLVDLGDLRERWKAGERPVDGFTDRSHNSLTQLDKAIVTEERISRSDVTYFFDPILRMIVSTPRTLPEKLTTQPAIHAAFVELHGGRWILPSDMTIAFAGKGRLVLADKAPRRYQAIVKVYRDALLLDSRLEGEQLWLFIDGETPESLRAYGVVFGLALIVVLLSIAFWVRSNRRVRVLSDSLQAIK